jgi:hypothetical protein
MVTLQLVRDKNIKFLILFNFLTLIVYYFGPVEYKYLNGFSIFFYVSFNLLLIYLGTRVSIGYFHKKSKSKGNDRIILNLTIVFSSILIYPLVCSRLGVTNFNPILLIDKIILGLNNPGTGYSEKISLIESYNGPRSILRTFNFFLSPFTYLLLPIGLFYFRNLNNLTRTMFLFFTSVDLLGWLAVGTNKGVIDLSYTIVFILLIKNPNIFRFKISTLVPLVLFFLFFIGMFLRTTSSRFQNKFGEINYESISDVGSDDLPIKNTGIYYSLNYETKFAFKLLGGYLSQGYNALDLSITEDFIGSYGFGNSWFALDLYKSMFGVDMLPRTYVGGILKSKGIDPQVNWHTAYVWFANDFTFVGVPFILFTLGILYNYFIKCVFYNQIDVVSVIMLFLISNVIFYLFANNQIMSFTFFPLFVFSSLSIYRRILS